jgi:hypothetical protein
MATKEVQKSKFATAYQQLKDFALGVHPLSKYASPLLLLADALLTSAIIYKVSCKLSNRFYPSKSNELGQIRKSIGKPTWNKYNNMLMANAITL